MTRRAVAAAGIVATALVVVACKPKAGRACKVETEEVCVGHKLALVCHDGKWEQMQCRGLAGCAKAGEASCDQSVAEEKDTCNIVDDFVCTGDQKSMLKCKGNRWTLAQSCGGARGCVVEGKKVTCDNSIANEDDMCREDGDYACTMDGKAALVCKSGKFVVASNCKALKGCKVTPDKPGTFKVDCDDSISAVGDPCEKDGHYTCAADEESILKCKDKKFQQDDKCRPKERCAVKGESVGCY